MASLELMGSSKSELAGCEVVARGGHAFRGCIFSPSLPSCHSSLLLGYHEVSSLPPQPYVTDAMIVSFTLCPKQQGQLTTDKNF